MAPVIVRELGRLGKYRSEIKGSVVIANRTISARADVVWDGGVMDFKTGAIPSGTQLKEGTMPQLPLEAYMLQTGGFAEFTAPLTGAPIMKFLKLQNGDVGVKPYTEQETQQYIDAAIAKATEVINQFSAGQAPYAYYPNCKDRYKIYDDLARK